MRWLYFLAFLNLVLSFVATHAGNDKVAFVAIICTAIFYSSAVIASEIRKGRSQ